VVQFEQLRQAAKAQREEAEQGVPA